MMVKDFPAPTLFAFVPWLVARRFGSLAKAAGGERPAFCCAPGAPGWASCRPRCAAGGGSSAGAGATAATSCG